MRDTAGPLVEAFCVVTRGGQLKGRFEGKAEAAIEAWEVRALPITDEQSECIIAYTDHDALSRWHRKVVPATSTHELFTNE